MKFFASELRQYCARKGSIAQLCKATGINRQQFNKYLAGQVFPGARNLRKICSYLGVSEEQLISGYLERNFASVTARDFMSEREHHPPRRFAEFRTEGGSERRVEATLRNGFYRAYFPVPRHPGLVARWLVHVEDGSDGEQVHSCRNHIPDAAALGFAAKHIRYQGPVSYGPEEACLIGTSHTPRFLQGTIFVKLKPIALGDYFSAMVLTRRPDGPLALSGMMHFLGAACTAREALGKLGVVRLDDPRTDPLIVRVMSSAPAADSNWLQSLAGENLRTAALPGSSEITAALKMRRLSV